MKELISVRIEDITDRGMGVGRMEDGMAVFVSGALPGDLVRCEVVKKKKRFANARTVEVLEESAERTDGFCAQSLSCGGCPYEKITYDAQLRIKRQHVIDALTRLGGVEDPLVRPAVGMEEPYRYRNKAVTSISTGGIITKKGGIVVPVAEPAVGFYRARSHETVDCPVCLLQTEAAEAAAEALRQFMVEDHITGYDPKWERGLMRHMIVRTAMGTGEVMVIFVINGRGIPHAEKLVEMLAAAIEEIGQFEDGTPWYSLESVILNTNTAKEGGLYGDRTVVLAGKPTITECIRDMEFEVSPLSFYQVNPVQMEPLYDIAAQYADLQGGESVLDLYCGAGTIGLWMLNDLRNRDPEAFQSVQVIGIESVKDAVLDANRNAVLNRIVRARYVCGKAENVLPALMGDPEADAAIPEDLAVTGCDVAVLDPPRAGCEETLLSAVCDAEPSRIVYVSCNPATLARDVKYLMGRGYAFIEATPVDLFPHAGHVECCSLLVKTSDSEV
ncbi:MAG: 23S rRNA (uracil(1939)-C(5))-methyltransferase RlmD [Eubacterium sp.]|nr:23S rRNA (uracil(1939)-C(5))-methyltransferase RlmD [Eubacterium sp.]